MLDTNGCCDYVLDPENPETWGGEEGNECLVRPEILDDNGVWKCPHGTQINNSDNPDSDNCNRVCIFHQPLDNKGTETVIEEFSKIIKSDDTKPEFLGAIFGDIHMDVLGEKIESDYTIDLTQSEVDGNVNLSNTEFSSEIFLSQMDISGSLKFQDATFHQKVDLTETHIQKQCDFSNCEFKNGLNFSDGIVENDFHCKLANFHGNTRFSIKFKGKSIFAEKQPPHNSATFYGFTSFNHSHFYEDIICSAVDFKGTVNFTNTKIEGEGYFAHTYFYEFLTFRDTIFIGDAIFTNTKFKSKVNFDKVDFNSKCRFWASNFEGNSSFKNVEFFDGANFQEVNFIKDADFQNADFYNGADFSESRFYEKSIFDDCELNDCDFSKADLTGSSFNRANMKNSNLESALLSRATLYGTDLRGGRLSGAVFADIRINEDTKLLGHPSSNTTSSPHTFSAIRSKPTCVYDPTYEECNQHKDVDKAKSVYRTLEELGGKHARPRLQARSFVRRQDLQKDSYKQVMLGKSDDIKVKKEGAESEKKSSEREKESTSLEKRLIAGARYSRAKVARETLLYGESPWRIVGGSFGFIIFAALLYPLNEWLQPSGGEPITYTRIFSGEPGLILESLYFSTLTFTTLGMGDYEPMGLGQLIATLNTTLGAVLIALLVFVLGRRAAR